MNPGEDNDFNVRRPEDLIQAQLATSRIMTILLGSIALLSLLVGGIGIMNIMLVSVTQRTREIGVRLAVGATEWDVQLQFLSEAVALSMMGGVLGVAAGLLSSTVVEQVFEFPTKLTPEVFASPACLPSASEFSLDTILPERHPNWTPFKGFATNDVAPRTLSEPRITKAALIVK